MNKRERNFKISSFHQNEMMLGEEARDGIYISKRFSTNARSSYTKSRRWGGGRILLEFRDGERAF